jgi:aldehyde:ferredoxin oxidoreductase
MQLKAIIVEGMPEEEDKFWTARISLEGGKPKVEFMPADEYVGRDRYAVFPQVYERFGKKNSIAGIGTAGEFKYGNSGIVFPDMKQRPPGTPAAGAWVPCGQQGPQVHCPRFDRCPGVSMRTRNSSRSAKKMRDALGEHAVTKPQGGLNSYGTAILVNILNEAGGLPTRNFRSGHFDGAAKIAGEAIFESNKKVMGKEVYNHACSPGCVIQCSNTLYDEQGNDSSPASSMNLTGPSVQTVVSMTQAIAEMVRLCNAYGLDTIEAGVDDGCRNGFRPAPLRRGRRRDQAAA